MPLAARSDMEIMVVQCATCGAKCEKSISHYNRAKKTGANLYCCRVCAGRGRRVDRTDAQRKEEKRLYDMQYREKNHARIKQGKAEYFKRTYDPAAAAVARKARSADHAEYCRRPEYVAWKREYDKQYRAKKEYGEFWQCFLIVASIDKEVAERASKTEIAAANGALNKAQTRKRDYERAYSNQP
jgi:hypothetical protein